MSKVDRIIALDRGHITAIGTYEELIAAQGTVGNLLASAQTQNANKPNAYKSPQARQQEVELALEVAPQMQEEERSKDGVPLKSALTGTGLHRCSLIRF